jgi:hypothetical protein
MPTPATALDTRPAVESPSSAVRATAAMGSASFTAKFAIPVPSVTTATSPGPKPQDRYMANDTPMAMAPPPGRVMATDVAD